MKSAIYLVTALMLISSWHHINGQMMPEYNAAYSKAPLLAKKSPKRLAKFLTKEETDDSIKVRNIYTWITNNIRYDVKKLKKRSLKPLTVEQILKKRKGICYQYTDLFNELCKHANIQSFTISGYSKGLNYQWGTTFYEADHSWNAVKVNNQWKLVDPTWGSGFVVQNKRIFRKLLFDIFRIPYLQDKYHFTKRPTPYYFDIEPKDLVVNHLPLDPNWQMLDYPVPLKIFEQDAISIDRYLKAPDSSLYLDYRAGLEKYEYKSEENQLAITAENSIQFNPRNLLILSQAKLSQALTNLSRTPETDKELIEFNKELISIYHQSKNYAIEHRKVINREIASGRRKMLRQLNTRMITPTKQINDWAGNNLTWSAKKLSNAKKRSHKLENTITKSKSRKTSPVKTLNYSKGVENPQVAMKLALENDALQAALEAYDSAIAKVKTIILTGNKEKQHLMADIMQTELEIDEWIPYVSNTYIRIYRLSLIDTMLHKVYQPMLRQMNLIKKLKDFEANDRLLWSQLKELEQLKISTLSQYNYNIRDLCTSTKGQECYNDRYMANQYAEDQIYEDRDKMRIIKFSNLQKDIQFLEQYVAGLSIRIMQTQPQVILAKAYKEFQLEKLDSRKQLSLIVTNHLIDTCNKNIQSLKAQNKEAAIRIRLEKTSTASR